MKQGSHMTMGHKGMRKGISLMEMLVAVILLGVLSSVGYNYYKVYFDTSLASKQIKVAVLIEQAGQLKNALQLYNVKTGGDVNSTLTSDVSSLDNGIGLLVTERIITEIPMVMKDISAEGWFVDTNSSDMNGTYINTLGNTDTVDVILTYAVDGTTDGTADRMDYCNSLNYIASGGVTKYDVTGSGIQDANATATTVQNTFFCCKNSDGNLTDTNTSGMQFRFITKIN